MVIATVEVVILLAVGRLGFSVHFPDNVGAFVVAIVVGMLCFSALGVAMSTLVPNQDAAGPVVSIIFFVLLFLSGLWFPIKPGSGLAQFSSYFPVHHLISAVFAPFDTQKGASPWAWHDLLVVAIWGVVGAIVAVRRWKWSPRRG
jgi:ABC-2 type transport system permease protein